MIHGDPCPRHWRFSLHSATEPTIRIIDFTNARFRHRLGERVFASARREELKSVYNALGLFWKHDEAGEIVELRDGE